MIINDLCNVDKNTKRRQYPLQHQKIGSELAHVKTYRNSKFHQDYWKTKVERRTLLGGNGENYLSGGFYIRMFHHGRREYFNLNTANKDLAAIAAKDIYILLKTGGWESVFRKYKPEAMEKKEDPTVGEFFEALRSTNVGKEMTLNVYIGKFRTILTECFEIPKCSEAYYWKSQEYQDWIAAVDRIKLSEITPSRIQAWKKYRLDQVRESPVMTQSTRRTINSMLRGIKSLFAKKRLQHLPLKIDGSPIMGIDMEYVPVSKYRSKIADVNKFLADALRELKPEPLKVFLLALGAGLRRNEIDKLMWEQVDLEKAIIHIDVTDLTGLKTASSAGDVFIGAELAACLKEFHAQAKSVFVVEGTGALKPVNTTSYHYRCAKTFKDLNLWLRSKGITSLKPIHELRKEFGSLICANSGIFAASRQLRHSNITLTNMYYLDVKNPAVVDLPIKAARQAT